MRVYAYTIAMHVVLCDFYSSMRLVFFPDGSFVDMYVCVNPGPVFRNSLILAGSYGLNGMSSFNSQLECNRSNAN